MTSYNPITKILVITVLAIISIFQTLIATAQTPPETTNLDPWVKETMQELQRLNTEEWAPKCKSLVENGQENSVDLCVKHASEIWYYKRLAEKYSKPSDLKGSGEVQ